MEIAIPLLVVLIPLSYQAWQYLDQRKRELRDRRFEAYHRLIRDLVEPPEGKAAIYMDRQVAIVFELRNFPEYSEVTQRILLGLKETWGKKPELSRLLAETDLTLANLAKG